MARGKARNKPQLRYVAGDQGVYSIRLDSELVEVLKLIGKVKGWPDFLDPLRVGVEFYVEHTLASEEFRHELAGYKAGIQQQLERLDHLVGGEVRRDGTDTV